VCPNHIFRLERKRVPAASALFLCLLYTINTKMQRRTKKEGKKMLPWWVMLIALIAGVALGLFMDALLIANERDDRP